MPGVGWTTETPQQLNPSGRKGRSTRRGLRRARSVPSEYARSQPPVCLRCRQMEPRQAEKPWKKTKDHLHRERPVASPSRA